MLYILDFLCWYLLVYYAIFCPTLNKDFNNNNKRFLPPLLYFCNYEPSPNGQIISLISKRDLIPVRSFWKDHLFRTSEKKYIAMYFFLRDHLSFFVQGVKSYFREKEISSFPIIHERLYSSATFLERPTFQDVWKKKIWFSVQWDLVYLS